VNRRYATANALLAYSDSVGLKRGLVYPGVYRSTLLAWSFRSLALAAIRVSVVLFFGVAPQKCDFAALRLNCIIAVLP
jgi:hypothetical protein